MTVRCDAPVSDEDLLDYWTEAIAGPDAERIEEHLFSCAGCAARLDAMASLGSGLAAYDNGSKCVERRANVA